MVALISSWSSDTFETLVVQFGAQYITCKPYHTTSITLINLTQADDEPLRNFMGHFS